MLGDLRRDGYPVSERQINPEYVSVAAHRGGYCSAWVSEARFSPPATPVSQRV